MAKPWSWCLLFLQDISQLWRCRIRSKVFIPVCFQVGLVTNLSLYVSTACRWRLEAREVQWWGRHPYCEECTVVPRGTDNTKIRYREYAGDSATQVYSGLGDYWGHLPSSTFPHKDDHCQKSCLQHSPCRQIRLSSQEWSGVRCSIVTSSETRVDWDLVGHGPWVSVVLLNQLTGYSGELSRGRVCGCGCWR